MRCPTGLNVFYNDYLPPFWCQYSCCLHVQYLFIASQWIITVSMHTRSRLFCPQFITGFPVAQHLAVSCKTPSSVLDFGNLSANSCRHPSTLGRFWISRTMLETTCFFSRGISRNALAIWNTSQTGSPHTCIRHVKDCTYIFNLR